MHADPHCRATAIDSRIIVPLIVIRIPLELTRTSRQLQLEIRAPKHNNENNSEDQLKRNEYLHM